RALLQLCDLVARAFLLVLERLDCALGAGERGAGALGLRVRRSACLLGGPGSGQRPLEVVLVCRRRALAGGVRPLLGPRHALRRGAGERERRRGGRRCRRRGGQRRRRRAPAGGLDHAGQLAQRLGERADLLLGDPLWGDRDQDDARDRCRAGVERHAGDGRDRGGRLDQRRYVAVLGRALDQVDAAVEQAVERHVPSGHAAAAYLAQALAALVREPHLCGQAEELVTLIEQAEGAGAGTARLEHGGERGLEHVLGSCGTGGDLAEPLGEACERRVRDRARAGRAATTLRPGGALHATSSAPTREPSSGTTPGGQTAPAAVLPAFVGRND